MPEADNENKKSFKKSVDISNTLQYNKFCCEALTTVNRSKDVGVAQLDRAFGYGPKGREFESSRPR